MDLKNANLSTIGTVSLWSDSSGSWPRSPAREIELAKQRGQLIAINDVEKVIVDLILRTKARLMALPTRVVANSFAVGLNIR